MLLTTLYNVVGVLYKYTLYFIDKLFVSVDFSQLKYILVFVAFVKVYCKVVTLSQSGILKAVPLGAELS